MPRGLMMSEVEGEVGKDSLSQNLLLSQRILEFGVG